MIFIKRTYICALLIQLALVNCIDCFLSWLPWWFNQTIFQLLPIDAGYVEITQNSAPIVIGNNRANMHVCMLKLITYHKMGVALLHQILSFHDLNALLDLSEGISLLYLLQSLAMGSFLRSL